MSQWMKDIDNNTSIAQLCIPGTHNSAACHMALPSVQCQNVSVSDQLSNGIRFLDVRLSKNFISPNKEHENDLIVIHGKFPVKLLGSVKLTALLQEIYDYLSQNHSETVILSLKQEGAGVWDNDNDEFSDLVLNSYIKKNENMWNLSNNIPKLADARGKIILLRRFGIKSDNKYGIDASYWSYNTTNDDRGTFSVQDWCEINSSNDLPKKITYIKDHLSTAISYNSTNYDQPKLFLNFASGANFFDHDCWPQQISNSVLDSGVDQLFGKGAGILILDYAESENWKLVKEFIKRNN